MNNYIKRFKTFIRWAYRNDYIANTSCIDKLKPFNPKVSHKEEIMYKYLSTEELKAVLDNCVSEQWKLVIEFLSLTGMRFGEFASLRADDFSETEITVQRTYNPAVKEENAPKTYTSFRKLHIQPEDCICIMTRGHENALACQAFALHTPAYYLGVIGSRRKIAVANERLREMGFSEEALAQLHTPIGLPIGAQTPAEIAVSIAAEMIQCRAAYQKG